MEKSQSEVQTKPVRLIAAVCNGMGIGKDGKMPWHLPSEYQYFLNNVTRVSRPGKMNMMIWGKLCWYSRPEEVFPLANVLHMVLSTSMNTVPDHAHFLCQDFESAVRMAAEPPLADLIETIWVVGGAQVYKDALNHPWSDLVYLTDIMADFDCDVFFPDFDRGLFKAQERLVMISSTNHYRPEHPDLEAPAPSQAFLLHHERMIFALRYKANISIICQTVLSLVLKAQLERIC